MEKLKVYCPYSVFDMSSMTLLKLDNITFEKPWYLEYNTDTSTHHPRFQGEDIVRTYRNKNYKRHKN